MDYFKFLPVELTLDIISRLPAESIIDCKSVCKSWESAVRHPSFSKMYLHRLHHPADDESGKNLEYGENLILGFIAFGFGKKANKSPEFHYFEYDENLESTTPIQRIRRMQFTLPINLINLGSINGLICLMGYTDAALIYFVCNPIMKQYVMLPKIKNDCCGKDGIMYGASGFGYVSSTNEYKVVKLFSGTFVSQLKFVEVHIYTLGSGNGWRNLGKFNFGSSLRLEHIGCFANGAIYWMEDELQIIVTFDLAEEKFREHLSPPRLPPHTYWYCCKIGVLDGLLFFGIGFEGTNCLYVCLLKNGNDNHDKQEGEEYQSLGWSKEFRIGDSKLLSITKRNGVLTYLGNFLRIYDTKASALKRLVDFKKRVWEVSPHKNTLVSLKELGEEEIKTLKSVVVEETESHEQPFTLL